MRGRAIAATVVLAAVACGRPGPAPVLANQAPPPPRPVCSDARLGELARELRARWQAADELVLRCAPGMFPAPGYFLEATSRAADPQVRRTGILAVDGKTEIVPFRDVRERAAAINILDYATADLDLDGIDEVVETWRKSSHGDLGSESWVVVRRVEDRALATIAGPRLSAYYPELGSCTARLELARGVLAIVVTAIRGIPPNGCLARGTHTFVLHDGAMVEKR